MTSQTEEDTQPLPAAPTEQRADLSAVEHRWQTYLHLLRIREKLSADLDTVRAELETALGDAQEGWINGQKVLSYRHCLTHRFQPSKFKTAHPELYQQFCEPRAVRTFRVVEGNQQP